MKRFYWLDWRISGLRLMQMLQAGVLTCTVWFSGLCCFCLNEKLNAGVDGRASLILGYRVMVGDSAKQTTKMSRNVLLANSHAMNDTLDCV